MDIRSLIAETLCVDLQQCSDEVYVVEGLGADSLSILSLYTEIKEECGIELPIPEDMKSVRVRDIVEAVNDYSS